MKIDELYNKTSVDISVLKSDINVSDCPIEQWISYQREAGFEQSFCLGIAYYGDLEHKANPRYPDIDLLIEQIAYALDVYTEKHSNVHIERTEWKEGYPDTQIDFCAEFSIKRSKDFLNFVTFIEKRYSDFMDINVDEFLGQSMFRDFNDYEKPDRNESFYSGQLILTIIKHGFTKYSLTEDIFKMRTKVESNRLFSFEVMLRELVDKRSINHTALGVTKDLIYVAERLYRCDMFDDHFCSIDITVLAHQLLDWIWKYKSKYIGIPYRPYGESEQKFLKTAHERIDKAKCIETVYSDSDKIDLEWIF